jgi:hypothetical protein
MASFAQQSDSLRRRVQDSLQLVARADSARLAKHRQDSTAAAQQLKLQKAFDKAVDSNYVIRYATERRYDIVKLSQTPQRTPDFLIWTLVLLALALCRAAFPKYFSNLFRYLVNPNINFRSVKDQLQGYSVPGLLLNILFGFVAALYIFYAFHLKTVPVLKPLGYWTIPLLGVAIVVLYVVKVLLVRFCGWVFKSEGVAANYAFNVLFINKVLAVLLTPFGVLLCFGPAGIFQPILVFSGLIISVLLLLRYVRTWSVGKPVLNNNYLHFFLYLCGAEIVPVAVLLKLITHWL